MRKYVYTFALAALLPAAASAATVTAGPGGFDNGYATAITFEDDNFAARRGVEDDRDNPLNALGSPDGGFFEIGFGSSIDLTFGTLFNTATIFEVTFGSSANFPEFVDVSVGMGGSFTFVGQVANGPAQTGAIIALGAGPFDTLRLTDASPLSSSAETNNGVSVGGFDVDSVRVSTVPLPASGVFLLAALGGAAMYGRKRKT